MKTFLGILTLGGGFAAALALAFCGESKLAGVVFFGTLALVIVLGVASSRSSEPAGSQDMAHPRR